MAEKSIEEKKAEIEEKYGKPNNFLEEIGRAHV